MSPGKNMSVPPLLNSENTSLSLSCASACNATGKRSVEAIYCGMD